jgi:uncharacterized protein
VGLAEARTPACAIRDPSGVSRLALAVALALLLAAACGGGLERGTVAIETADGRVVEVAVEIADDPEERRLGLMGRASLPEGSGMLFDFGEDVRGAFTMRGTLVPLSIAFADASGRIVRVLDMEPCRAEPCPSYDPGVVFRAALEVNRGAFRGWGVAEGDRLAVPG